VTRLAQRSRPWVGAALAVVALGSFQPACDQRFEFDIQPGGTGAGGAPTTSAGRSTIGGVSGVSDAAGAAAITAGSSMACGALHECTAGTHCTGGQCAQCAADADCAAYGLSRCEPTRHRCVACVDTSDCARGFACDSLANRCLQTCLGDDGCPASAHGCDERRQVCYQCDEDRECINSAIGRLCASDGSGCVQCRKETDCPGQHCDQLTGHCVECRDAADCTSQLCNPVTFGCVPN
jgi:hypothetical protein